MRTAENIVDVLEIMDEMLERFRAEADPRGLFLALYRAVTREIHRGIEGGRYDDGDRMSRFDAVFANRYFEAVDRWDRGERPTRAWRVAFEAGRDAGVCVVQHLLLGINAHINLDLGVSAAAICPGPALPALGRDFERINDTLKLLLDVSQDAVNHLSPMMGLIDTFAIRADEMMATFSVQLARREAWENAEVVGACPPERVAGAIDRIDRRAATLGRLVARPGALVGAALRVVRTFEEKDVRRAIEVLAAIPTPA
ncbi:MAG: hypothetical protein H6706_24380 [Myxococcales bacterium]|nr:hypothetical protein [Myxococcales bacterium]